MKTTHIEVSRSSLNTCGNTPVPTASLPVSGVLQAVCLFWLVKLYVCSEMNLSFHKISPY